MRISRVAPIAFIALSACASAGTSQNDGDLTARARLIQDRVISIDTHDDIPGNFATAEYNPCNRLTRGQVDLPRMREGGLDVAFFVVYVGQTARTPENYEKAKADALNKFTAIHRLAEQSCPDQIEIAYTADDVERIVKSGKLVAAIGIENGFVIGKDLSLIEKYAQLGGRYMTLAHNGNNDIAGSAQPNTRLGDAEQISGLTPFGEQVVAELNKQGILVDISHISKLSALDAIRLSKAPVIASHSGVYALNAHPRNLDDETLRALKTNGGVIQVVGLREFVKTPPAAKAQALQALRAEFGFTGQGAQGGGRGAQAAALAALSPERRAEYDRRVAAIEKQYPEANVQDFVNHIDYAVKLIGIDHVGISSDFDGGGGVDGWDNAAETINVTKELLRRGYTEEQIRKMWGGNTLRIWGEAARVSRELKSRSASE
jgi:membrane dipeptidase